MDTRKRGSSKFAVIKDTDAFESRVLNESESVRDSLVESAHLKSHFHLLHALYCCFLTIKFARMDNIILVVLFELKIFPLETIEVLVEVKAGEVQLLLLKQMTFFNFFLVNFVIGGN